jgi:hypothetical protein
VRVLAVTCITVGGPWAPTFLLWTAHCALLWVGAQLPEMAARAIVQLQRHNICACAD